MKSKIAEILPALLGTLLFFPLFSFLAENAVCEQPKKRDYWPTNGWKTSTPEQQGMDSAKLMIADEFIQNRLPDAFSLLVVKNGYLKKTEIGNGMETKFQNSQSSY